MRYFCLLTAILLAATIGSGIQQSGEAVPGKSSCSDDYSTCKKPVKFVSEDKGCYVFACEHGTEKERLVHVHEEKAKTHLETLVKQSVVE
jgi:hypothetical protein